jgi:hypothetical protein
MSTPDKRESMSPKPCIHMRLICHFDHRAKKAEVDGKMVTEADSTNPNPVERESVSITTVSLALISRNGFQEQQCCGPKE